MIAKTKIGVIGCGNISDKYLEVSKTFQILEVVAVSDMDMARAKDKAVKHGIARAMDVNDLLGDPEIEIVLNLTPPSAHAEIALKALAAGKSIYNEKPLAIQRAEAQAMLQLAAEKGLRIGCAPDTFLGAGLQTCRKAIDDGLIGRPVAATAFMMGHGPEAWHSDPDFFYQVGGGPMFDMGPYYLTALVTLLGPVKQVTGISRASFSERVVGSGAKKGQIIKVNTPTHLVGALDFASGAVGTLITSFDVWKSNLPRIEIYGSEGTLSVPDPNTFGGPVMVWKAGAKEWQDVPLVPGRAENSRSLGLADMATAIRSGRQHRANGQLAYHVLDIMHAIHEASSSESFIKLASTVERPAPLALQAPFDTLD